jgi:hypothetical protein
LSRERISPTFSVPVVPEGISLKPISGLPARYDVHRSEGKAHRSVKSSSYAASDSTEIVWDVFSWQRDLEIRCHQLEQELRLAFDLKLQQERHFESEKSLLEKHHEKETFTLERQIVSEKASVEAYRHDVARLQSDKEALERQLGHETAGFEKLQREMASQESVSKLEMTTLEEALSSERKTLGECRIRLVEIAGACKYALLQLLELRGVGDEISVCVHELQCALAVSHDEHIQQSEKNERDLADSMNRCLTASGELH